MAAYLALGLGLGGVQCPPPAVASAYDFDIRSYFVCFDDCNYFGFTSGFLGPSNRARLL